jgi:hypothetical protein
VSDFSPPLPNQPSFQVRRRVIDGDFVRGPGEGDETYPDGFQGVLRYGIPLPEGLTDSMLVSQPQGYDAIKIWWGVPPESLKNWTYMAVVRSGFGHPSTPADGEIILGLDGNRADDTVPGSYLDTDLPSGQWFYYSLMFRVGTRWYVVNTTENVVPIDYAHRDKLFDLLPPFYQDMDEETWAGTSNSMLKRFFATIGYDLDLTRTLTEGIDTLFDPDRASMKLLGALGEQNFGFKRNEAIGDIRYRGIIAASRDIQNLRGTSGGIQSYLAAATQYRTTVTPGKNLLLLGDDASFAAGTGNWCFTHYGLNRGLEDIPISTRRLKIEVGPSGVFPEGIQPFPEELTETKYPVITCARVQAGEGDNEHLALSCGVGQQITIEPSKNRPRRKISRLRHLNPFYRGIAVDEGKIYYLSFWMCAPEGSTEDYRVSFGMAYYPRDLERVGFSDAFGMEGFKSYARIEPLEIDVPLNIATVSDDSWNRYVISSQVPEGARFLVPVIWVHDTDEARSPITTPRYIAAAMVNQTQGVGVDVVYRPNFHLKLTDNEGDDTNVIGEPLVEGDIGKVIGEP